MNWRKPELAEKADIARALNKVEPHYRFNPDTIIFEILELPFYEKASLVKVFKTGTPLWYVRLPDEIVVLDGSAANLNYLEVKGKFVVKTATYAYFRKVFGDKNLPEDYTLL